MRMSSRDHLELQDGLRVLYSHHDLDTLPAAALGIVSQLVPCDSTAYNEIDPARRRLVALILPQEQSDVLLPLAPVWERFMHQHPLVTHFQQNPGDSPRKITDFLPQRQFEETDLYREFFRRVNVRYQMVTTMPSPAPLVVGISHNRSRRDFSERERSLLDLLRPHLRQAYENACVVTDLSEKARQLEQVIDRIDRAVVTIDSHGSVKQASPAAIRLLGEYLRDQSLTGAKLPETVARWAVSQVAAMQQRGDAAAKPGPLMLDGARGRLVLRLVADQRPGRFVIVMHHAARLDSAEPLRGLGLTEREAQVLYWCVEGKSRGEIGVLLGISERTVQKHLEHIYAKLDVPSRVAAVTKALEWLRW